jgi:ABC-type multidrug transport system fused ATPase/permease subunit
MMSFVIGNVFGIAGVNVGLNTIMDEVVEIYNDTGDIIENDDEVNGELALEDVVFSYPEKMDVVALNKVSFKVDNQKNRVIALVGTSGCGKSSCIALL